jgi:hypothetical protein
MQEGHVLVLPFDQSNDLVMPTITAELVRPGGPPPNEPVHWLISFDHLVNGPGYIPGNLFTVDLPHGSDIWNITSAINGEVHGGNFVTLRADYVDNGVPLTLFQHIQIKAAGNVPGGEPTIKTFLNSLYVGSGIPYNGTPPWFATRLIRQESEYHHFNDQFGPDFNGYPNYGTPNGWGVMQKENPTTNAMVWNWKENMSAGKDTIEDKRGPAWTFWQNQVNQWQAYNALHPPEEQVSGVGPIGIGTECTFGMGEAPGIYSWRDALWIQAYNGAPNGYYLYWDNPSHSWAWHLYNNENPPVDYVLAVCSRQP